MTYSLINDRTDELITTIDEEGFGLWLAAPNLLEALVLCEDVLSKMARLNDGAPSIAALIEARNAIAQAKKLG